MSISSLLSSISGYVSTLDTIRTNIRSALVNQGVSASDHDFSDFASDIAGISGGGVTTTSLSVTANGTYTAPAGTAYTPVTVNVGSVIPNLPNDGKTRICYKIPDDAQNFGKTITLDVYLETADTAISVDWGDDSEATTASGEGRQTLTHAYSTVGEHIVTVTITAGTIYFGGGSGHAIYGGPSTGLPSYVYWAVFGTGVTMLSSYVFSYCTSLREARLPSSGLSAVNANAFEYCASLTSINLPNSITSFGTYCFSYCYALSKLTLPNTITALPGRMFMNCRSLIELNIPNTVTSIGSQCFASCVNLQKLRFNSATPPTVDASNAFSGLPTSCIISVPTGKKNAYTSAANYPSSSSYTYIEE